MAEGAIALPPLTVSLHHPAELFGPRVLLKLPVKLPEPLLLVRIELLERFQPASQLLLLSSIHALDSPPGRLDVVCPGLLIGVCGEHGGDPDSIDFFASVGVDYVSCSPPRIPVARLAAAQAALNHRP